MKIPQTIFWIISNVHRNKTWFNNELPKSLLSRSLGQNTFRETAQTFRAYSYIKMANVTYIINIHSTYVRRPIFSNPTIKTPPTPRLDLLKYITSSVGLPFSILYIFKESNFKRVLFKIYACRSIGNLSSPQQYLLHRHLLEEGMNYLHSFFALML